MIVVTSDPPGLLLRDKYLSLKRKLIVLDYARVFGNNLEAYK